MDFKVSKIRHNNEHGDACKNTKTSDKGLVEWERESKNHLAKLLLRRIVCKLLMKARLG